jgi:cold shock CspA family protein
MRRAHAAVIGKRSLVAVVVSLVLFGAVTSGAAQDKQDKVVRVPGRVQWIAGEKMMLIPDNGALPVEVDIKQVPQDDYRTLKEGDPVVVSGAVSRDGRKLIATSVQPAGG